MAIAIRAYVKKFCTNQGSKDVILGILRETLLKSIFLTCVLSDVQVFGFFPSTPVLSSMPSKLCDLQLFGFSPATPSITLTLSSNVLDELLWSVDGFEILVQWVENLENHDYVLYSFVDRPFPNSTQFHPKGDANVFGHLFNPYISLHLE